MLEAELERRSRPVVQMVAVPVIPIEVVVQVQAALDMLGQAYTTWAERLDEVGSLNSEAVAQVQALRQALRDAGPAAPAPAAQTPRPAPASPPAAAAARPPAARPVDPAPATQAKTEGDPGELRAGARRMVEALGRMAPLRLTKSQWGTVARLKTSGGTWVTYLSDVRRRGFLDETSAGYTLTEVGFDYLGGRPEPMTAEELQNHYRSILRAGAVKMFDALIQAYPAALTRDELGATAGIVTTGGTFSTYLSDLVRNGLAERQGTAVAATTILMHGSTQA